MRLLLDTHIVIWMAGGHAALPARVKGFITEAETSFVSFATAWEYVIKQAKGSPEFQRSFPEILQGFPAVPLGIDFETYTVIQSLPPIHSDPFDRLLIAQAMLHDLTLVTKDADIHKYNVKTFW